MDLIVTRYMDTEGPSGAVQRLANTPEDQILAVREPAALKAEVPG